VTINSVTFVTAAAGGWLVMFGTMTMDRSASVCVLPHVITQL